MGISLIQPHLLADLTGNRLADTSLPPMCTPSGPSGFFFQMNLTLQSRQKLRKTLCIYRYVLRLVQSSIDKKKEFEIKMNMYQHHKSIVLCFSIIIGLMFMFVVDSESSARWDKKSFANIGYGTGYKSFEHETKGLYGGSLKSSGEGRTSILTGKFGRTLSQTHAVYLRTSLLINSGGGIGMMVRPSSNSSLFFFGDVGIVSTGGPFAVSGGIGVDISRLTLDISGLVAGGGSGRTTTALITISYLWSR